MTLRTERTRNDMTESPCCCLLCLLLYLLLLLSGTWANLEGTFTIRLLQTTTFQNISFADTEGLGLLEDIELGSLDKHTWSIHLYQPWVRPALPRADWDAIEDLIKIYLHKFNHQINEGAMQRDVPYPFVVQCMAGCVLYPNNTSQGFAYVGYNGQDFLSLNTKNATWTLSQDTKLSRYVQSFLQNETAFSEMVEMIFNDTCVDDMEMLLHYGRAALERQVPSSPCQPLSHVGTFTIRLLQTTTFQNTSFVDTEGLGLLEDIKLGYFDKHTWSIHLYQPWVRLALPQANWDNLENLIKNYLHRFNHRINEGAMERDVPYPFVAQCMAGCTLYPNRTSQGFFYVGYNGQDFLSLNTKNATWTLSQDTTLSQYVQSILQNYTIFTETVEIMFNENCVNDLKMFLHYGRASLERQELPVATVFARTPSPDQLMLICHVTGFYPHPISVAWLRDGQEVPPGPALNTSPILPNADLTYQLRSVLAVAPRDGHSYVCRVRHQSLGTRSLLIPWESSSKQMEESESRNSILSNEA
ncbi:hypothetical protein HGM15179_020138 [Zosterops borbonicus]|uniref:Ig-like domain-containing protein n=2 Tax=Zosterops borbonicus TaxID=364589 RepID=A0A8K1FXT3_9PASS|nr:hypothetical protein HGM15179_020138 [Zosterops borbonicus]